MVMLEERAGAGLSFRLICRKMVISVPNVWRGCLAMEKGGDSCSLLSIVGFQR